MSFINLLTENKVWEARQLTKRAESFVRRLFSRSAEELLNRKLQGALLGRYTLTDDDKLLVGQFDTVTVQSQQDLASAVADNDLLGQALAYEQADRDLSKIGILISGVPEVPMVPAVEEVFEEIDPDTLEVIVVGIDDVEEIPAIPAIEPLATEIDSFDDNGFPIVIPNPAYTQAVTDVLTAQTLVDNASAETLALVELRA